MTLTQVQAVPLRVLLDLPASDSGPLLTARDKQIRRALALLGVKSVQPAHHKSKAKSHRKARHVRKSHARTHA